MNVFSLAIVVIVTWMATRWVIDRTPSAWDDVIDLDDPGGCPECEGVGALVGPGLLRPCPACDGTGIS